MPGRPFQPGNRFGRGRPKGSRNKKTLLSHEILDSRGPAVLSQAFDLAQQEDPQMIRILLPYLIREKEAAPVKIGALPMRNASELAQSSEVVLQKVANGEISATVAGKIHDILEQRRRILETQDLEARLRRIEGSSEYAC
jgi:hypothetical protein